MKEKKTNVSRRDFLQKGLRGGFVAVLAGSGALLTAKNQQPKYLWQIDPYKCIACGKCSTSCVLQESAVKCVHAYAMCGYCDKCNGYYRTSKTDELNTAAENQLCPRGAIKKTSIEDPYFEYTIDETKCKGCGRCVLGCNTDGNGSLFLQIRHDRCVNCNECAIVADCPSNAVVRTSDAKPYLLKGRK